MVIFYIMFRQYNFIPAEGKLSKAAALKYLSTKIAAVNKCHATGKKCMQFGSVLSTKHLYKHKLWNENAEQIWKLVNSKQPFGLGRPPKSKDELKWWIEHKYKSTWTPGAALQDLQKF